MYSRKKPTEELPEELTVVWTCTDDHCNGWMRENFATSATPVCTLCQSEMVKGERMLVAIANNANYDRFRRAPNKTPTS